MLVTEIDAKQKYCPFLTTKDGHFRVCQGTKCMMWRFAGDEPPNSMNAKGYCGLAGLPVAPGRD